MSDLQDYLLLVEQRKAERKPLELVMPSGATWLYTPINIAQYAVTGRLPTHLIGKMKMNGNGIEMPKMSTAETADIGLKALEIVRDVMLNNLVFPKISLEPKEGCITPEQIDPEDFDFFTKFVIQGGQSSVNSFRQPTNKKRK